MNSGGYLAVLLAYAGGLVALGLYLSRRVHSTKDFFVAGRQLPPGLIFATFLAANIGAGSTVGATGRGYSQGLSAVWWVGSAGLGSLVLAFFVGPRIYRLARQHNLLTVGDFLEMRYSRGVRLFLGATLWLGCLFILAGQLIAIAWILNVTAGLAKPWGCALGGLVVAVYFSAGGLRTAAWLHVIQIAVKMTGFFVAVPWALHAIGGWDRLHAIAAPPGYFSPVGVGLKGVLGYIVVFMPNFFIAPGLIQKLYGARDESAVRKGVGWQAAVLLLYAVLPAVLGMIARAAYPGLANPELALPTLLRDLLPWWLGALLLGGVFSAELSAGDAVLFMLSTSLGKDLYKSLLNPAAGEEQLLRVTKLTSAMAGVLGTALAMVLPTVVDALTAFYGLLTVVLMVPLLSGLYLKSPTSFAALATMATSVIAMLAAQFLTAGKGIGILNPVALGIAAGAVVMVMMVFSKGTFHGRHVSP
ncbi:MAG TPA: sodium:solute symporter family protein [Bryobacteraceae bacterium]